MNFKPGGARKSDDYINARFDLIKPEEKTTNTERKDATVHALEDARTGKKDESNLTPAERTDAARVRMHERGQKAWEQPLAASLDTK